MKLQSNQILELISVQNYTCSKLQTTLYTKGLVCNQENGLKNVKKLKLYDNTIKNYVPDKMTDAAKFRKRRKEHPRVDYIFNLLPLYVKEAMWNSVKPAQHA